MPDPHLEADFPPPEFTTPQGTQEHGVDFGHEERDVNFRSLLGWFGGLGLFVIVSVILLAITSFIYEQQIKGQERAQFDAVPLLTAKQIPPRPFVLPNPVDTAARPHEVLMGPWDIMREEAERENGELRRLGLQDEQGLPQVPQSFMQAVMAANAGAPAQETGGTSGAAPSSGVAEDGPRAVMPSVSSGGTSVENDLR